MNPFVVQQPKQWQALLSPVRLEIVGHLELYGPSSIAEVAFELGRTPHSLYHHFRTLVEVQIVQVEGIRRSGARDQAVYSLRGAPVIVRYEPDTRRTRAIRVKAGLKSLRQAGREFEQSVQSMGAGDPEPEVRRYRMRLRPRTAARIERHLDAIVDIILKERLTAKQTPADARWYTWVSMLASLAEPDTRKEP